MNNSKHTRGPWTIFESETGESLIHRNGIRVAIVPPTNIESHSSNTHLIAAAPDLLEACKLILRDTLANGEAADSEHVRVLEQAIAKAEGR